MPFQAFHPIALVNARLVDPARGTETRGGVFVRDGYIVAVGADVTAQSVPSDTRAIDCAGDVVSPGLIDMQAFVGEPGAEHRETIATATTAAAIGGVTTIVSRSDTNPPVDDPALGPIAAAKVPLTPLRSLAVDKALHTFSTPVFITVPRFPGGTLNRLVVAQDTGSAIVGAARGDFFTGSGDAAGELAGVIRHAADFHVLVPKPLVTG